MKHHKREEQLAITGKENLSAISTTTSADTEPEKFFTNDKNDRAYHNVKMHLEKIHNRKSEIEDPYLKKVEAFNRLRKIVKKL